MEAIRIEEEERLRREEEERQRQIEEERAKVAYEEMMKKEKEKAVEREKRETQTREQREKNEPAFKKRKVLVAILQNSFLVRHWCCVLMTPRHLSESQLIKPGMIEPRDSQRI